MHAQQALTERHQLQDQNAVLQHRLAEMFQKRTADDTHREEHSSAEQERRYLNYMGMYCMLYLHHDCFIPNKRRMLFFGLFYVIMSMLVEYG